MKKTISTNISGMMFNIDDDAFARLSQYLGSIKIHFEGRDGQAEIIADIESRIAELLQSHLHENKQVISIEDVNEVIALLGQPFEMDVEDSSEDGNQATGFLPKKKRLFRDPDNRKIAGVASGIGMFFVIDPLWVRIIFILLLLGSGAGLLIYIVLWILIPEARTTTEKLEMRGEPVNVNNIEKSIKEEYEKVSSKFNEYAGEAKDGFRRVSRHARHTTGKINDPIIEVLRVIARVFSVIFGVIFLAFGLLLILFAGSIFLGWDDFSLLTDLELPALTGEHLFPLLLSGPLSVSLAPIVLGAFIAIPLIMLVYIGMRLLMGEYFRIPGLGNVATGLWIASVVGLFYIGTTLTIDLKEKYTTKAEKMDFLTDSTQVLTVKLSVENEVEKIKEMQFFDIRFWLSDQDEKTVSVYPNLYIEYSTSEYAFAETTISAQGSSYDKAKERAERIHFPIEVNQSHLSFPAWYRFDAKDNLRGQKVITRLYLPENWIVYFDKNMEEYFNNNPLQSWRHDNYAGNYWIMTKKGLQLHKPLPENISEK